MKRILAPTDFSQNADNALSYAVSLANEFGSELVLLHLYDVISTSGVFSSVEDYMKEEAAEQMLQRVQQTESALRGDARVTTHIAQGNAVRMIPDFAEKLDADLIVMGTQGATGLQEIFIGNTTGSVLKYTRRPVLAIPEEYRFKGIESIVLAMDEGSVSHAGIVRPLVRLARQFDAHIHVFHQDTGDADPGIDLSVDMFLENTEHSFHYELVAEQLNESIKDFVEDENADLLCMIRRQRGFLKKLFHASATSKEILDSQVPLLVLHDVES